MPLEVADERVRNLCATKEAPIQRETRINETNEGDAPHRNEMASVKRKTVQKKNDFPFIPTVMSRILTVSPYGLDGPH